MRVDQGLGNCQTEAESSKPAGDITLSLFKCVKYFPDGFGFNANAGVDNAHLDFVRRRIHSFDANPALFRSELHAVLDQIPENLLQACRIPFYVGTIRT